MKILISAFLCLFAGIAFGDEVINLNAGLSFMRCEGGDNSADCTLQLPNAQQIQISLVQQNDDTFPEGQYTINQIQDGYNFQSRIDITKITVDKTTTYLIIANVSTNDGNGIMRLAYVGSASVNDISQLSEISWIAPTTTNGTISDTPELHIGPSNANFSVLYRSRKK